ncbi:MAG: hypothetical protein H0V73_04325, partial [Chloroflexi bacterium]|nr:hypothetical protein [Chloroflexota bacterium]
IIAIAILVLSGLTFLAAYRSDSTDPEFPSEAQVRQEIIDFSGGMFEGMTQAELDAQIDQMVAESVAQNDDQRRQRDAEQQITLQKYAFPQSVFTVVGSGIAPILALILIASLAVGDEFRFGTIRTSFLAAGDRRRFLAARLVSLLAMTVGLFGAIVVLGAILGIALVVVGAEVGSVAIPIVAPVALAWLGAQVLCTMVLIALGTALTVLLRSGALPLLLILVGALVELFVANLPVFGPREFFSGVPQAFLVNGIRTLTTGLGLDTHALALAEAEQPLQAIAIPPLGVAAIIAAWGILFVVIADRRLRTMDVTE